jgi:predicted nucleotidyltransferase
MNQDTTLTQRRAEYAEALDCALNRIVAQLAAMPEVERVILFGSYAAGRRDLFTDLDLLVVMASGQDFVRRTAELYRRIIADVDLDLLVYTPSEFERLRERGFVRQALGTGKVLYEKKCSGGGSLLDGYYIPTRYPNGLPDGIPADVYTEDAAKDAVAMAEEAVGWVKQLLDQAGVTTSQEKE